MKTGFRSFIPLEHAVLSEHEVGDWGSGEGLQGWLRGHDVAGWA